MLTLFLLIWGMKKHFKKMNLKKRLLFLFQLWGLIKVLPSTLTSLLLPRFFAFKDWIHFFFFCSSDGELNHCCGSLLLSTFHNYIIYSSDTPAKYVILSPFHKWVDRDSERQNDPCNLQSCSKDQVQKFSPGWCNSVLSALHLPTSLLPPKAPWPYCSSLSVWSRIGSAEQTCW